MVGLIERIEDDIGSAVGGGT